MKCKKKKPFRFLSLFYGEVGGTSYLGKPIEETHVHYRWGVL
jgi:hypothetical protein